MAKKLQRDLFDETPFKLGVWIHKKSGKIAIAHSYTERHCEWSIDLGKVVNHPFFRIKVAECKTGNGNFFFNRTLKDYEFLQENITGFKPGMIFILDGGARFDRMEAAASEECQKSGGN